MHSRIAGKDEKDCQVFRVGFVIRDSDALLGSSTTPQQSKSPNASDDATGRNRDLAFVL